jgi:hypothetical protein
LELVARVNLSEHGGLLAGWANVGSGSNASVS